MPGIHSDITSAFGDTPLVRLNRVTNSKFDTFAHDLHDFFATGARVGEVPAKR